MYMLFLKALASHSKRYLLKGINKRTLFVFERGPVLLVLCLATAIHCGAQETDSTYDAPSMTLDDCVEYSLHHQPAINQSRLNISVAHTNNAINLSGWLPQVNVSGNLLHYGQLPTSFISSQDSTGNRVPVQSHTGFSNTFIPQLSASQTIFNPQLLYAAHAAPLFVRQAQQIRDSTKIGAIANVSKAFYSLLQTLEQIKVLKEDTARLDRNVTDTYHQYVGGIVDETDYDEAVITLNNSKGQLTQQLENVIPQYATLKQLMGFPSEKEFNVYFDTAQMIQEISYDTTEALEYQKRIEYQMVQTSFQLQHSVTTYYGLSFLPTVSAIYNYYHEFESNSGSSLFNTAYPYSYIGLTFSLPIFTGFSRLENIHKSKLQEEIIDWDRVALKSQIYTQYTTALANYKSNFYNWRMMADNEVKAKNVYRIVSLQYKQGIVAYLNMIVAESNLISAEIGYNNALFQLLSSKIDLEKAMGNIPANNSVMH